MAVPIIGSYVRAIPRFQDDRGYLCEIARLDWFEFAHFPICQSNLTMSYPGIIKAFHWHKEQDDLWFVVKGTIQAVLYDLRPDSMTYQQTDTHYLGENNPILLKIPRYVAHGYKVVGNEPATLIYFVNKLYDPRNPDEQRIPHDDPSIGYDWGVKYR